MQLKLVYKSIQMINYKIILKNEHVSNRREIESFYEQYGATPLRGPNNPNKKTVSKERKNLQLS